MEKRTFLAGQTQCDMTHTLKHQQLVGCGGCPDVHSIMLGPRALLSVPHSPELLQGQHHPQKMTFGCFG